MVRNGTPVMVYEPSRASWTCVKVQRQSLMEYRLVRKIELQMEGRGLISVGRVTLHDEAGNEDWSVDVSAHGCVK
jgi:hypothetical protein